MLIDEVRTLPPIERFLYWIEERESIRLRRENDDPPPWTNDEILQTYRFCNVRRMDDKVSQWLLMNWYKPYFDHPNMLAAVALARFVNRPQSLCGLSYWLFTGGKEHDPGPEINWACIKSWLRSAKANGETVFNGAYMVRGNSTKSPDKIGTVVDEYVRPLWEAHQKYPTEYVTGGLMWLTHAAIQTRYGFGSFMSGQIVADLRWAIAGTWSDRNSWAPVGPGSARGLARLLHDNPYGLEWRGWATKYVQKPLLWLKDFQENALHFLFRNRMKKISERLEAMDLQNCLCEFDKYERVLWGEGKPKQLYKGGK